MKLPFLQFGRSSEEESSPKAGFRVVVLHDDHLTAQRGRLVARGIAREMGVDDQCETALWNVELLGTPFGRAAALDASAADIVIVALRTADGFSLDLKIWLRRWLANTKHNSVALIAVFENYDEPAAANARAFLERAALGAGKECFNQPAESSAKNGKPHEFLWVL